MNRAECEFSCSGCPDQDRLHRFYGKILALVQRDYATESCAGPKVTYLNPTTVRQYGIGSGFQTITRHDRIIECGQAVGPAELPPSPIG